MRCGRIARIAGLQTHRGGKVCVLGTKCIPVLGEAQGGEWWHCKTRKTGRHIAVETAEVSSYLW